MASGKKSKYFLEICDLCHPNSVYIGEGQFARENESAASAAGFET